MSGDILYRVELRDKEQARQALARGALPWIGEQLDAGRELVVTIQEIEDARSIQQNSFYWGFVLKQISAQAVLNGIGAEAEGWHYWLKKNVLGYRITKTRVPGSPRPVIRRELRSTKGLSVRAMSKYLEEVMARAATDFSVSFDGKKWEDWR